MNQEESNLIAKAKLFAHNAHDSINQRRKYTDQPYWVHTDAVADTVAAYGDTATMVAAANLHDVLEDVSSITKVELEDEFPLDVVNLVIELTDVYVSAAFPKLNRETRKKMEVQRIAQVSPAAQTIKLADLYDNTKSIVEYDKDFAVVYLREKSRMLKVLTEGNRELYAKVLAQLNDSYDKLALTRPK